MLDQINKVKSLADQLSCLVVSLKEEDVAMTMPWAYRLRLTIWSLYSYWISSPHESCTRCLKKKVMKPQKDDAAMVLCKPWAFDNNKRHANNLRYYNYGKLGHIACHCRSNHKVNANIATSKDNFAFFFVKNKISKSPTTRWIGGHATHDTA